MSHPRTAWSFANETVHDRASIADLITRRRVLFAGGRGLLVLHLPAAGIKRGSHARGVQRDRLDLDAHDLSLLRFLEHRVERVRLAPAVYWRVDSVRNGSPRVDGSFGHARIDPQV